MPTPTPPLSPNRYGAPKNSDGVAAPVSMCVYMRCAFSLRCSASDLPLTGGHPTVGTSSKNVIRRSRAWAAATMHSVSSCRATDSHLRGRHSRSGTRKIPGHGFRSRTPATCRQSSRTAARTCCRRPVAPKCARGSRRTGGATSGTASSGESPAGTRCQGRRDCCRKRRSAAWLGSRATGRHCPAARA